MTLQTGQIIETPGAPQVAAYPLLAFGAIEENVGIGLAVFIHQKIGGLAAVGEEWIVGATPIISGHIFSGNAAGGALEIQLSLDGITWDHWHTEWLVGGNITYFGGYELPGYNAKFRLFNSDAVNAQLFQGLITMKGI
jgi:hypothetical protein